MSEVVTVRLLGVAPAQLLDLLAGLDALHREVQMTSLDDGAVVAEDVTRGLVDDRARLEVQRHGLHDQAVAARDAGLAEVDLLVTYRSDEIERVRSATVALAAANEAAVAGTLLVPPLDPELHRLWRFLDAEFETQVAGGPATRFEA